MIYKCTRCKTSKSFLNPAPTETAYCVICECSRLFVPDTSSTSAMRPPLRSSGSASTVAGRSGGSIGLGRKSSDQSGVEKHRSSLAPAARPWTSLARSSSMRTFQPCGYFKLCLEFMLSLGYSKRLFNRKHNRCYCEQCYPASSRNFLVEGGSKYVIPRGWVRFGLNVDDALAEAENIWNKWIVSYHGTSSDAAKSIIEHHQFLLPGDQCIGGHVIGIGKGHIPNKFEVYTSPTIAYSSHKAYCPINSFRSASGQSYRAQIVIQCRQQPGTYKVQAETVAAGSERLCPIIPNSELEYFTEVRSSIVPYGLLIRVF